MFSSMLDLDLLGASSTHPLVVTVSLTWPNVPSGLRITAICNRKTRKLTWVFHRFLRALVCVQVWFSVILLHIWIHGSTIRTQNCAEFQDL